jgi:hypothetical protein
MMNLQSGGKNDLDADARLVRKTAMIPKMEPFDAFSPISGAMSFHSDWQPAEIL